MKFRAPATSRATYPRHGYAQLLDLVQAFGYARSVRERRLLDPPAAAALWWDERYLPTCAEMRRQGMQAEFPYRTDGDLFLVVHERRQNLSPERRARARTKRRRARPLSGPGSI